MCIHSPYNDYHTPSDSVVWIAPSHLKSIANTGRMKRIFDLCVGLVLLLLFAVPLLICMVVLRFTGVGEVFYRQARVGKYGEHFMLIKFATMVPGSETKGTNDITVRNDPRVLPVGRFLRKTKLNELPQIFNVLKGDISVVGWRPLMPRGFGDYSDYIKEHIVKSTPGLTGIGSIIFRDEEAIVTAARDQGQDPVQIYRDDILPYKGAVELWYNENRSLLLDIKIILLTAYAVLSPGNTLVYRWFKGLPEPESPLVREHTGFNQVRSCRDMV